MLRVLLVSKRPPTLQVEQLFDNGTHPTIAEPLFSGEYGAASAAPAVAPSFPACPGQLTIDPGRCPGSRIDVLERVTSSHSDGYGWCSSCGVRVACNKDTTAAEHDTPAAIMARHGVKAWRRAHRYHPDAGRLARDGSPIFPLASRTESAHHGD